LLVKVYPEISGQLTFIGLIQYSYNFSEMQEPPSDHKKLDHHYMLTNSNGMMANVTAGLLGAMGLHPKFFIYSTEQIMSLINLESIAPTIMDATN
jgi:hypothetical protein